MRDDGQVNNQQTQLSVKKQILFTAIILCGLLVVGELSIRIWAYYFRTSYEHYNRQTGRLELVPDIHYKEKDGREFRINARGFVGQDFMESPEPGTTRIIAVGDSCTFTLGLWEMAYPSVAQGLLNKRAPGREFEYINAGIEGYNSTFALARIREEILRYKPHIVTIYIGWNDLMKVNPEGQADRAQPSMLAEIINESYLLKAYNKLIFVSLRPLLFQPSVTPDEVERHAFDQYVPRRYERNLRDMISELKGKGIQVILFTLPTVLERGLKIEDLKARGVFFPYYAGTFSVDRLLSLHAAYNRTIRLVGEQEQVPVVDLDEAFGKLPRRPLFWDTMHPSEKGNVIIAELVTPKIIELINN